MVSGGTQVPRLGSEARSERNADTARAWSAPRLRHRAAHAELGALADALLGDVVGQDLGVRLAVLDQRGQLQQREDVVAVDRAVAARVAVDDEQALRVPRQPEERLLAAELAPPQIGAREPAEGGADRRRLSRPARCCVRRQSWAGMLAGIRPQVRGGPDGVAGTALPCADDPSPEVAHATFHQAKCVVGGGRRRRRLGRGRRPGLVGPPRT